ncbi:unnamed protein product [Strongylus vulgaris]|uniref:Uncharacterized protein n=1 Tax=Strongylus vulgaris TaxID=40348 RepID=A0A3P7LSI3_STRVU|nr:unnamed protein product [Strongylus vulgaris]
MVDQPLLQVAVPQGTLLGMLIQTHTIKEIGTGVRPEYPSGQGDFGLNTHMPNNPSYPDSRTKSGGIGSGTQINPPYPGGIGQGAGSGARDYNTTYPGGGVGSGIGSGANNSYGGGTQQGVIGTGARPDYGTSYPGGGVGSGAYPGYSQVGGGTASYTSQYTGTRPSDQGPPPLASEYPGMKRDPEARMNERCQLKVEAHTHVYIFTYTIQ